VVFFRWVFLGGFFYCQPCLVQQQVVQRRNCVEEHRLHGRGEKFHQGRYSAGFEDGEQALARWNSSWTSIVTQDSGESFAPTKYSQSLLLADFEENHTVLYCTVLYSEQKKSAKQENSCLFMESIL
jgi:hypothetical protein